MNNFFEQFKNTAKLIRMSETEKTRIRSNIFGSPTIQPVASPYASYFMLSLLNLRTAVAAVLVIVLAGSSTAYAAQGALPGDLLYAVKVSVNEKVELALATTPEQKIKTEVSFADRRVAEVQALDAEGRLNSAVAEEIEMEFDKHAERALALEQEATTADSEMVEDTSVAFKTAESPQSMMMQVTVEISADATSTATDVEEVEYKNDDLFESLQEKKKVFQELRERAAARGEVRGASQENRGKNGNGKENN